MHEDGSLIMNYDYFWHFVHSYFEHEELKEIEPTQYAVVRKDNYVVISGINSTDVDESMGILIIDLVVPEDFINLKLLLLMFLPPLLLPLPINAYFPSITCLLQNTRSSAFFFQQGKIMQDEKIQSYWIL